MQYNALANECVNTIIKGRPKLDEQNNNESKNILLLSASFYHIEC